ncbi:glucan 1,3-beta-glucosidase 2 [Podospora didyma]|uniref:glucan 1,3-beta-glucosidase n=1 Tax=Podospora didyma TaxID=330526 RepID=A0AAE0TVS2_9PEZI|nr:glucan 1,3-beta-glucosidase 2 [Podospora didyma]
MPPPRDSAHRRAKNHKKKKRPVSRDERPTTSDESRSAGTSSQGLSSAALAQLNRQNARRSTQEPPPPPRRDREREREIERERIRAREKELRRQREKALLESEEHHYQAKPRKRESTTRNAGYRDLGREEPPSRNPREKRRSGRVVSGAILEEGRGGGRGGGLRGGVGRPSSYDSLEKDGLYEDAPRKGLSRKKCWIIAGVLGVIFLIIIIAVAVVVSKNNSNGDGNGSGSSGSNDLNGISPSSIPAGAPSWLNPFVWQDTTGFNVTYTDATVGDLPLMGLYSSWDDSAAANDRVPALNKDWGDYAKRPARGVNVGGWLSLEPFITPSLFEYDLRMGIIDEYTLCTYLGSKCESTLEKHYATFVTEDTFKQIADAGLDHVRIPFSYWAVQTYDGDPYVFRTSWRYLLRAIEWCRKYGLRVNLDLHGLPGSQNGWNHSGRQGAIGWLNGTDGDRNAQRSLDVHDRLSKFFAQDRYKNIISHYGLANEPKMTFLSVSAVLQWTETAYNLVRKNGISKAIVVFGDGFRGLGNWQGELTSLSSAALDVHQYVIFNTNQIVFNHTEKVRYACDGWTEQTLESSNRATGFGPTLVAEWSQADTDCARHLTNVGWGNRWTGTFVGTGDKNTDTTTPRCPLKDTRCDCKAANADPGQWPQEYKQFLRMFAEAQMHSFEKGYGWFYWVWDTESAPQWSYKKGLAAGVLPAKAYERSFDCASSIPSFSGISEAF